jgi:hypothetical protein
VTTYTHGLNAKGEIVGCYFPDPASTHSLRVAADGTYSYFERNAQQELASFRFIESIVHY